MLTYLLRVSLTHNCSKTSSSVKGAPDIYAQVEQVLNVIFLNSNSERGGSREVLIGVVKQVFIHINYRYTICFIKFKEKKFEKTFKLKL